MGGAAWTASAASVFAVGAAMSDYALDLPEPPEELLAVVRASRDKLVGENGLVEQLGGVASGPLEGFAGFGAEASAWSVDGGLATGQEEEEEAIDLLALRRLILSRMDALSGILHQRGFHVQVLLYVFVLWLGVLLRCCFKHDRCDHCDNTCAQAQSLHLAAHE